MQTTYETKLPSLSAARIAILQASWHREYTDLALRKCTELLKAAGCLEIETHNIPGSLELPYAAKQLLSLKDIKYDGIICFGAILKGETYHFELVANNCTQALMQLSLEYNTPIINEVLACYDLEQLKDRCADNSNNKGIEAAVAFAEIFTWKQRL